MLAARDPGEGRIKRQRKAHAACQFEKELPLFDHIGARRRVHQLRRVLRIGHFITMV